MLPRNIQSSDCLSNPAAGYRDRVGTGALLAVGANGYVWSSSTFASGNINAGNMDFNATWVNPLNANNRSNGFSVRCVQHLCGSCFLSKSMIPKTACHPEWRRPRFAPERSIDSAIRWRSSIPESVSFSSQFAPGRLQSIPRAFKPAIATT